MKIVIAPDSFKGSLTAKEVCDSIETGIKKIFDDAQIVKVPMADGGEGTVQSLVDCTCGKIINIKVKGPLMNEIESFYGILGDGDTAVIEMAAASGLPLLKKEEYNPMKTTTYGTGELIRDALGRGVKNIIIGLGGSATNDGGAGMLSALGVKFSDENKKALKDGINGESLGKIREIDLTNMDKRLKDCNIVAACDVTNPLCGKNGASYIFGPQKGADPYMAKVLDSNLKNYGKIIEKKTGIPVIDYPGAGAAGGLGSAILAFLNGKLEKGIDIVIKTTKLEQKLKNADLVVTGEGRIDYQTQFGKTPYGVACLAKKYNIPVIAIAGSIGSDINELHEKGFEAIFSIVNSPMNLDDALKNASILLQNESEEVFRLIKVFDRG